MKSMRTLFLTLLALSTTVSFAQLEKPVSVNITGNFNIAMNGLGTDDAGVGLNLQTSFFARKKLQLTTEATTELFFGNKVLYQDTQTGSTDAKTRFHSIRLGPQVFFTKNIALSATYGPTWYKVRDFDYSVDYGFKVSINSFLGNSRRIVAKASFVTIPAESRKIQYISFGLGYRL